MDPSFSFPTPLGASLSLNHLTTLTNVFGVVPGWSTDDFLMIGLEEGGRGAFLQVNRVQIHDPLVLLFPVLLNPAGLGWPWSEY